MNLGVFELNKESIIHIPRSIKSSLRTKLFGIPKAKGSNLVEIASSILKENARDVLIAGQGHFTYMWVTDFAKAFVGAAKVLPQAYLKAQLQRIIDDSYKEGYVPTCYAKKHIFNMPFRRQDNFTLLVHAFYNYVKIFKDKEFLKNNKSKIEFLYNNYMRQYFDFKKFILKKTAINDWMDTIARPSSTYSNLCLLNAFNLCKRLKLNVKTFEKETEKALIKRWNGKYFLDYEGSDDYLSADANVFVLYFNLFSKKIKKQIFETMEKSNLVIPFPLKARDGEYGDQKLFTTISTANYHSLIWPHLGLIYLNGLKKNDMPYKHHLKRLEDALWKYRNMIEVFDETGKPFSPPIFSTEYGLTMVAGPYLELVG